MNVSSFHSSANLSNLQVMTASAGEEMELECIVSGGNPPAKISWFVGAKAIR